MERTVKISQFLDASGRILQLPQKNKARHAVLEYLVEKFDQDRTYSEQEVNDICSQWHTFEDYFVLRRELVDHDLLQRRRNGSLYWRTHNFEQGEEAVPK